MDTNLKQNYPLLFHVKHHFLLDNEHNRRSSAGTIGAAQPLLVVGMLEKRMRRPLTPALRGMVAFHGIPLFLRSTAAAGKGSDQEENKDMKTIKAG